MEIATFVLAVVGTVLAAASLTWQAATYVLTGGRVSVELRTGALHASGSSMVTAATRDADQVWAAQLAEQGYTRPLVVVKVRNIGRMPVTIERWSLACSGPPEPPRNRGLLAAIAAASSRPRRLTEFQPVAGSFGPQLPHRLDAGSSETWGTDAREIRDLVAATLEVWKLPLVSLDGKVELGDGRTARTPTSSSLTFTPPAPPTTDANQPEVRR